MARFGRSFPMPIRRQSVVVASPPAVPTGVPGTWGSPIFDDEFVGTALDLTKWWVDGSSADGESAANVSVAGGFLILQVSTGGGALISTGGAVAGGGGFEVYPGDFVEASINFAGSGASIDNYPAFFIYGENWPADGENDIAEGINNALTVNYHSPSGAHNFGVIPGSWAGAQHTFGIYRGTNYCQVYYDGTLVRTYSTDDDGGPQRIILATGPPTNSSSPVYGSAGQMLVDYVRTWSGTPTTTTPPMAAIVDGFPGTTLNAQWGSYGTATVAASGLALDATAGYSAIYAQNVYNLTASQFAVKLTPPAALSLTGSMQFGVELDVGQASGSTGGLGWDYSDAGAATITAYYKNASGAQTSLASITWAAGEAFWARIRESGGTVYWDYCTDGVSWVNAASVADTSLVALTALYPQIFAGHYDADTDQTAYVQDVNVSTTNVSYNLTTADSFGVADSAVRIGLLKKTSADTTSVIDAISRSVAEQHSSADTEVVSDVASNTKSLLRASGDATSIADALSRTKAAARTGGDATSVADALTRTNSVQRPLADSFSVSDVGSGIKVNLRLSADSTSIADTSSRIKASNAGASDTSSVSDALSRTAAVSRTASTTISVTDLLANSSIHLRTSLDTTTVVDITARKTSVSKASIDSTTVSDSSARGASHARPVADAFSIADAVGRTSAQARMSTDSSSVSDATGRIAGIIRVTSDLIASISDATTRGSARPRSAVDAFVISDLTVQRHALIRASSDSLSVSDALINHRSLLRSSTETVNISDLALRQLNRRTTGFDSTTIYDLSSRSQSLIRNIIDPVIVLDAARALQQLGARASEVVVVTDAVTFKVKLRPPYYGPGSATLSAEMAVFMTLDPSHPIAVYMYLDPASGVTVVDPAISKGILANG